MPREQQQQIMELIPKVGNTNITNTTNNTQFNLQFFLNETCKNAMNITEFADSVELQLTDLENVGKMGFVDGISNIIVKNLKALDIDKRPVHCTDYKREILYIKDDNKLINIEKEYHYINLKVQQSNFDIDDVLIKELFNINFQLWEVEDKIREYEFNNDFSETFVFLARQVYTLNDKRSKVKKEINLKYDSVFVEEKSYNYI